MPTNRVLHKFLELPSIYDYIISFIKNEEQRTDIEFIFRTTLRKNILKNSSDKTVLLVVKYFDDVEINNPLGTHRGLKKLGAKYYTIASIPFEYSSKLENILLAQLHMSINHKDNEGYSQNDIIFSEMIDEIKDLCENSITINKSGINKQVYIALTEIIGDNLGLNTILGYTASFNNT